MPSPAERHDPRPLLDQTQAADFLAVCTRTLEGWRSSGGGPRFVRVGRRVRYRLRDLQKWIDERTFGSTAEVRYRRRLRVRRYASRSSPMSMWCARVVKTTPAPSSPVSLSLGVALRRWWGSISPASFPPLVLWSRCSLPSTGSLGDASPASAVLRSTPTPHRPFRAAPVFPRGTVPPIQPAETMGPPRFLGSPCAHAPLSDPGGPVIPRHDGMPGAAFRRYETVGHHDQ